MSGPADQPIPDETTLEEPRFDPGGATSPLDTPGTGAGLPAPPTDPAPAAPALVGEFEVERELARGGMGVVYVARSRRLGRRVALKLLKPEGVGPEARERFAIEARAAARLRHPNVVGVHEVGESEAGAYLAMDLIEGESLQARLRRGPMEPRAAARIAAQLARALAYAHAHGVLHRDVKPANVLLDREGQAVLGDFGLAKELEAPSSGPTRTGQLMGTPAYMSPEQVRGDLELVDRRADVWGLGATLYEMLVGRPPFAAPALAAVLLRILREEPVPPRRLRPGVDRDLETIVLRCLEKESEQRYPTAAALAEDLESWLGNEPILARRPGPVERVLKWSRRNRGAALGLVGATLVLLVTGGVGGAVHVRRLERERVRAEARSDVAIQSLGALLAGVEQELQGLQDPRGRRLRRRLLERALGAAERLVRLEQESGERASGGLWLRRIQVLRLRSDLEYELGRVDEARATVRQAEELTRRALELAPKWAPIRRELAMVVDRAGRHAMAAGEPERARAAWEESRALTERMVAEEPGDLDLQRDLATAIEQLVRLEVEQGDARRALAQAEDLVRRRRALVSRVPRGRRDLPMALGYLSDVHYELGASREAILAAGEGLALASQLPAFDADPDDPLLRLAVASLLSKLARAFRDAGEPERARQADREARVIVEERLQADPGSAELQDQLAAVCQAESVLAREAGEPRAAQELAQRGVELRRGLFQRSPQAPETARHLIQALITLAGAEAEAEAGKPALAAAREAVERARELVRGRTEAPVRADLAEALDLQGRLAGDAVALEEALTIRRELAARSNAGDRERREVILSLEHLADQRLAAGDAAGRTALREESLALARTRGAAAGASPQARRDLAITLCKLASERQDAGDIDAALAAYREAVPIALGAAEELPSWAGHARSLERHVALLELALADPMGPPGTPREHLSRAYALAMSGGPFEPALEHFRAALADASIRADLKLGHLRSAAEAALRAGKGDPDLALEWLREDVRRRREALRGLDQALAAESEPARRRGLRAERVMIAAPLERLGSEYEVLHKHKGFLALLRAARDQ